MSKKRKALMVLLVLVVAAIPAYFWLFTERALADSMPGDKPVEIRFEEIAAMHVPLTGIVAGAGWGETALTFFSFQVLYGDHFAMKRIADSEPKLVVVPGHDKARIEQLVVGGFLKGGFEAR